MLDFFRVFCVGFLTLVLFAALSVAGLLLFPLILAMGFLLRWLLSMALIVLTVWLVGKAVLLFAAAAKKRQSS
ncbi:MAG: hypothetical protein ACOY3K_07305 [Candidatus Omnitrophota bacterium]